MASTNLLGSLSSSVPLPEPSFGSSPVAPVCKDKFRQFSARSDQVLAECDEVGKGWGFLPVVFRFQAVLASHAEHARDQLDRTG